MNTSLNIQTESQISEVKFSEQASIYNAFAAELDIKQIKKFRDKATGVARILKIQDMYVEACDDFLGDLDDPETEIEEAVAKADEPALEPKRQTRFDMESVVVTVSDDSKEGTIENSIHAAIYSGHTVAGDLVEYLIANHKRPRSGLGVDEQYVVHNIKYFVKKGTLKLITK